MLWRSDFPALQHHNYVYADNAATSHKPTSVVDAIDHFYRYDYAPIYRGIYRSAEHATQQYENARDKVAAYMGASRREEIIFTKSATEGVNIIAWSWAWHMLTPDDEIVITDLEHHANLVTWQRLAQLVGCKIRHIPVTAEGELDLHELDSIITSRTKFVALSAASNVIGVPVDYAPIVQRARAHGAFVMCDATQRAPRQQLAVREDDLDACVISPHKMLGPTGVGVLYIAHEHHDAITPYLYGGGMVHKVLHDEHVWRDMPHRCEGGSPPSAQVIGFSAAIDYLQSTSLSDMRAHEASLCRQLISELEAMPGIHVVGPKERIMHEGHIVSWYHTEIDAQDIAAHLDTHDICVRAGHHCAQPLHTALGVRNTVRVSWYGYNAYEDVSRITLALKQLLS